MEQIQGYILREESKQYYQQREEDYPSTAMTRKECELKVSQQSGAQPKTRLQRPALPCKRHV